MTDKTATAHPTMATEEPTDMPSLGLSGLWAKVANFSAVVVLAGVAVYGVMMLKAQLDYLRSDFKEQRRETLDFAKEAHQQFLLDAKVSREQTTRQWDEVRKSNELNREMNRSIQEHQRLMEGTQLQIKAMVDEVKRVKMGGGSGGGN
jgi:hypothetical protein